MRTHFHVPVFCLLNERALLSFQSPDIYHTLQNTYLYECHISTKMLSVRDDEILSGVFLYVGRNFLVICSFYVNNGLFWSIHALALVSQSLRS